MRMHRTPRLLSVVAALALVVGVGAGVAAVSETQSAWVDKTYASAAVTAGEWSVPVSNGCTAVYTATQQPVPGATCSITRSSVNQWNSTRDHYIELRTSAHGPGIQHLVTIDLSTIAGGASWNWATSVTVASGAQTVTSSCAELPILRATMPENLGATPQLWQRVEQQPTSAVKTCK